MGFIASEVKAIARILNFGASDNLDLNCGDVSMNVRANMLTDNDDDNEILARLAILEAEVKDIRKIVTTHDTVFEDINDVKKIVGKIWGAMKYGAPTVIGALVTAGYIDGTFGRLLTAVFQ